MKKIIIGLFLAFLFSPHTVHAQAVNFSLSTAAVCVPVTVSSSAPTAMIPSVSTTPVAGAPMTVISIQNQDSTNSIFCSQDNAVAISGSHRGWSINAGCVKDNTILSTQQWYCIAQTGAVNAEICPLR